MKATIKEISTPFKGVTSQLEKERERLEASQTGLVLDKINVDLIERTKAISTEVSRLSNIEEQLLKQRARVDWLKLGDATNIYFYASLKSKKKHSNILTMVKEYGSILTNHEEFITEILNFNGKLVGTSATNLKGINIVAMRQGRQVSAEQGQQLVAPIIEVEIKAALKGISTSQLLVWMAMEPKFSKSLGKLLKQM